MTPTAFAETLKTLTDDQLAKLERVLLLVSNSTAVDPDAIPQSLATPLAVEAQALVDARAYELALDQPNIPFKQAMAQAVEDYRAGRLDKPEPKPEPTRRLLPALPANFQPGPSPAYPPVSKTNEQPSHWAGTTPDVPLPPASGNDNVIPFAGKCFHSGRSSSGTRWIGGDLMWPGN